MQKINISLRILDGVNASVVDEYNQLQNWTASIVRGMNAELVLKLFSGTSQDSAMAQADLNYASWYFVMSDDWDTTTEPQIRVSSGITVDEDGLIHIPLTDTNTEELIATLGTSESVTLGCELCGFSAGETPPAFVLQWDISVRNRRSDAGTGTPTAVPDGSYNAAQVDALLAAKANSADIIIYVEGTGIDITDGTVSIDTTGATTGQVLKKTESGVGWEEETVELPEIIEGDNDKVLTVVSGTWAKADLPAETVELPVVTTADNDKILTVVAGAWAAGTAPVSATTANVHTALSIDTVDGTETKVLTEKGTFVDLPGDASDTVAGIIELATNTEANEGTDDARAVTPASLAHVLAQKASLKASITAETTSAALTVDPGTVSTWTCNGATNTITGSSLSTGYATARVFVTLPSGDTLTAGSGATMDDTPTADAINLLEIIWYNGLIRIRVLDHWAIPT